MASTRKKRNKQESIDVILEAALNIFTQDGFAGASLRKIAQDAGITPQLLTYHFKSKEDVWKSSIEYAFECFNTIHGETPVDADSLPEEKLAKFVRDLVLFNSKQPKLLRIMVTEASMMSPRLSWLIEHRSAAIYKEFVELAELCRKAGVLNPLPTHTLFYAVVAMASLPYSVTAEYEYLTGVNPFSKGEVERTIGMITTFLIPSRN